MLVEGEVRDGRGGEGRWIRKRNYARNRFCLSDHYCDFERLEHTLITDSTLQSMPFLAQISQLKAVEFAEMSESQAVQERITGQIILRKVQSE